MPDETPIESATSVMPPPPPIKPPPMELSQETVNEAPVSGRPLNVTIIGVLLILYAFTELHFIINLLSSPEMLHKIEMAFRIIAPLAVFSAGIGLLMMKPWARMWAIFVIIANMMLEYVFDLFFEFTSGSAADIQAAYGNTAVILYVIGYLGLILYNAGLIIVAIYCLTRPNIKEAFARR